jgi:hypothetical protein
VSNAGSVYQGRHRPSHGRPPQPYPVQADQPEDSDVTAQLPTVVGAPVSGSATDLPPTVDDPWAPLDQGRKKIGKLSLIIVAFALLCAAVAVTLLNGGSGENGHPAAAPTGAATPADPTGAPESSSSSPAATPAATGPATAAPAANTDKPGPRRTRRAGPPTKPPAEHSVHPGALCSPAGALGYTANGKLMRCSPSATDSRNRWRVA